MSVSIILLIIVIPLLVLFIKLSIKRPGLAAIIALASIILFVLFYFTNTYHIVPHGSTVQVAQPSFPQSQYLNVQSPIWSEGIENEFEADVYPSGISALRSLAPRVIKNIPYVMGESGSPKTIVIYSNSLGIEIAEEFRQTISKLVPEIKCRIEISNTVGIDGTKEVGIHFTLTNPRNTLNNENFLNDGESGSIQARLHSGDRTLDIQTHFTNKFWVQDFSSFINSQPNKNYIIAKSNETSLSPEEADRQAMQNAIEQIWPRLLSYLNPNKLEYKDILESGIVADKFVQSFDGSSGKIWREAILLDVSPANLQHLANMITNTGREMSKGLISIIGLFVLIMVAYAFLNAATRGYYSLTLKIVGIILAAIFLFVILHFRYGIGPGNSGM